MAQQEHIQRTDSTALIGAELTDVLLLPNTVGTHACGDSQTATALTVGRPQGSTPVYADSNGPNGACSIIVTQWAAGLRDVIIGTFTGVASHQDTGDIQVTHGSFQITRTE